MISRLHPSYRACGMVALLVIAAPLVGCSTYLQTQEHAERIITNRQRQTARLQTSQVRQSPAIESPSKRLPDVESVVSERPVDAYVREALERNPGIQAAIAHARAQLERIPQVTSLADPILRAVTRPEPIQTAAGDVYFTFSISQTFPLLAKLERSGDIAAAQTRLALEQLNSKRIQVIADVERAYWQIYRVDRNLEITRENRRVLEDLSHVVETQYEVGDVPQQDLLRVQTEIAKLRDDERRLMFQRRTAAAALNRLADQAIDRQIPTINPVNVIAVDSDVDDLIQLAANHNPELAILNESISAKEAQVELARLGYWPDLTLGFEWNYLEGRDSFVPPINPSTGQRPAYSRKSEVGDDNWAVMLQFNLPIWTGRVEAAKREAHQRLIAAKKEQHDTENMIAFRVFDAWSRVQAQQHTLRVLDDELIPQSRQTYEVTLTAYQSGKSDFVALIDHWRRWLDFELMRHRETVDLELAFTDLQREVGMQLLRNESANNERADSAKGASQ
ncbi:MAG: TolC family protein [Phycisphaerales bacterium]|nr:TolC family protein [Phycisphaerales bacterium]